MSLGIQKGICKRLWLLFELMQKGHKRATFAKKLGIDDRLLLSDITRIKKLGIPIRHKRSNDTFVVEWPKHNVDIKATPEELFYFIYIATMSNDVTDLKDKIRSIALQRFNPFFSVSKKINKISDKMQSIADAIESYHKIAILYKKQLIELQPLKMINTSKCYVLLTYNASIKDFEIYSDKDIVTATTLQQTFNLDFDLDALIDRFELD